MFDIHTIEDIQLLHESCELECKKAGGRDGQGAVPESFWETYSAMANTDGGVILLGVMEKGGSFSLSYLTDLDKLRRDIFSTANNRDKVSVNLLGNSSMQDVEIGGKKILRVDIPRASRADRPVFLNGNPLGGNAYRRLHEGDQKLSDEAVKRLLAEQMEDSRDGGILPPGFTMYDLCQESIRAYRQTHQNLKPGHPWGNLDDSAFLAKIGAWRQDRMSGEEGMTRAGLLMFGTHPVIQEAFPHYMLDYQERPEAKTEMRWVDRVTLDGTWSGNLYDFYRKVYPKLVADLKTPFQLEGGQRKEETPVHIALREALVNTLVHADYSDRASVLVVKRPDMFGFRNPGTMRIPVEIALKGGEADCRNRLLHQMFRYIGLGEQSGSGIPKILEGWKLSHWRLPLLYETMEPYDQTLMELRMLDLFPNDAVTLLRNFLGLRYDQLGYVGQVAMALALTEGTLTHGRLVQLVDGHPADLSRILHRLVHEERLLTCTGSGRGAVYHLAGLNLPHPDDVFGATISSPDNAMSFPDNAMSSPDNAMSSPDNAMSSPDNAMSSPDNGSSSPDNAPSSPDNAMSSPDNGSSSPDNGSSSPDNGSSSPDNGSSSPDSGVGEAADSMRDLDGRLMSSVLPRGPIVDSLEKLSARESARLRSLAQPAHEKRRLAPQIMRDLLAQICFGHYVTIGVLAELVSRETKSLQSQYLTPMVRDHQLYWAFPTKRNDPRQAYIAVGQSGIVMDREGMAP